MLLMFQYGLVHCFPNFFFLLAGPPSVFINRRAAARYINYTGPREIPLDLITNLNVILYLSTCHTVHMIVLMLFVIMP